MTREIPPLKARPETIPRVLQLIRNNEGDFKKMESAITEYWRTISIRTKEPSRKNSLRAVFGPTLRHLQLIRGEGDDIKLLPKAKELLKVYESEGEIAFKRKFAEHLLKLEKTRWMNLMSELGNYDSISIDNFFNRLVYRHPDAKIDKIKLRKYLSYLKYAGLVTVREKEIKLRKSLVDSLLRGLKIKISEDEFKRVLIECYKRLRIKQVSSYVPVPELRDAVLEVARIWPDQFDDLLKKIPKETSEYLIHLSQPMVRESDGIKIGGKYFYYIAVYTKREE